MRGIGIKEMAKWNLYEESFINDFFKGQRPELSLYNN